MRKWILPFAIIALTVFQLTILGYFKIWQVKPDLLLTCMVMTSLIFSFDWKRAISFSIFSGALKDIFYANNFGINTLVFTLWSIAILKVSKNISIDNNFNRAILICVIAILNNIIIRLIFLFLGNPVVSLGIFLGIAILESLYTALVSPLVFKIIKPAVTL